MLIYGDTTSWYTKSMIKVITFDCFGVLTQDGWLSFCQKYMNEANQEELRYINHQADKGLVDYETFLATVCKLTGAPREEAHAEITTRHTPNEPVFEIVRKLKDDGYTLGVISNVGDELGNFLPQECVDLFNQVTLSYHVHAIKPDPQIYEYHLSKLGIKPQECVFIDDREPNVAGAIEMGIQGILYTNVAQLKTDLQQRGIETDN